MTPIWFVGPIISAAVAAWGTTELYKLELENLKPAMQVAVDKAYKQGYEDATKEYELHKPKMCVNWWFNHDIKSRHKQIKTAFCKGKT